MEVDAAPDMTNLQSWLKNGSKMRPCSSSVSSLVTQTLWSLAVIHLCSIPAPHLGLSNLICHGFIKDPGNETREAVNAEGDTLF